MLKLWEDASSRSAELVQRHVDGIDHHLQVIRALGSDIALGVDAATPAGPPCKPNSLTHLLTCLLTCLLK